LIVAIDAVVEIHDRIIRPQPVLDFLAGDNPALTFKEHPQHLKYLFSRKNVVTVCLGMLSAVRPSGGQAQSPRTERVLK
jgi:hypothetical protein